MTVGVIAESGEQPYIQPHQAHIVGDVPAHAAQTCGNHTWVGIRLHKGGEGTAADVHIDPAHHHGVASGAQDVALARDAALPG